MLSDSHLIKHIVQIHERFLSAGDYGGGGHSGVSLGIYCGILGESPQRLADIMYSLTWDQIPKDLVTRYDRDHDQFYFRPAT